MLARIHREKRNCRTRPRGHPPDHRLRGPAPPRAASPVRVLPCHCDICATFVGSGRLDGRLGSRSGSGGGSDGAAGGGSRRVNGRMGRFGSVRQRRRQRRQRCRPHWRCWQLLVVAPAPAGAGGRGSPSPLRTCYASLPSSGGTFQRVTRCSCFRGCCPVDAVAHHGRGAARHVGRGGRRRRCDQRAGMGSGGSRGGGDHGCPRRARKR